MEVAIAGGHGKIALRLTRILAERGDIVRSLIRNPDHASDVESAGGAPVICDLETSDPDEIAEAVGSADAVVFAAGAGPGSGPERKETVDLGAAAKLMDAAKIGGIDRYVMISSTGADPTARGDDTFAVYLRAKGRADETLADSGLAYTIVRPTRLTDDPGTGKVLVAGKVKRSHIPRDDVAAVIARCLIEPATIGKTFEVASGDEIIEEALARL